MNTKDDASRRGSARTARALGLTLLLLSAAAGGAAPRAEAQAEPFAGLTIHPEDAQLEFPVTASEAEWRSRLTAEQYAILRGKGTEMPFSGEFFDLHQAGTYYSAATGQPLFRSDAKFDSGTGWPSFFRPIRQDAVVLQWDSSHGMRRVEVMDSSSGSHLGHVFEDGPAPTGLRYCINSAALLFVPEGGEPPPRIRDYLQRFGE